jgi:uncharacterized Zn finger protein
MAWYHEHPPARPRRVQGGITARSRRGAIGDKWWSRRFIDILESFDMGSRLTRGRAYARSGQVLDLEVAAGSVAANVQGSRPLPYEVWIELKLIWPKDWRRIQQALAARAIYTAKLLAGEMPTDIESVFTELGLPLFPAHATELSMECNCPDWAVPCKHIAATFYVLAEAFDDDPFLIFTWRGCTKEDLLSDLRALRGTSGPVPTEDTDVVGSSGNPDRHPRSRAEPALADRITDFWRPSGEFPACPAPPADLVPDLLLRQMDPVALQVDGRDIVGLLRPTYDTITTRHR